MAHKFKGFKTLGLMESTLDFAEFFAGRATE
jgi:hypothetical protein